MDGTNNFLLNEWLADISAYEPIVCPEDVQTEATKNLWSFSLSTEHSKRIEKEALSQFVRAVARKRAEQVNRPMMFYCWFDEQACHLCMSLASVTRENLPFGCNVIHTDNLDEITGAFLDSDYHEGIPWEELQEINEDLEEDEIERDYELKVWSITVGPHQGNYA